MLQEALTKATRRLLSGRLRRPTWAGSSSRHSSTRRFPATTNSAWLASCPLRPCKGSPAIRGSRSTASSRTRSRRGALPANSSRRSCRRDGSSRARNRAETRVPWQWSLTLRYRGPNLSDLGTHTAGIQPAGFFHTYQASTLQVTAATKVTQLQTLNATLGAETVKWTGNRAPKLVPTVSEEPRSGSAVLFSAGASDPDGNPITAIGWFFEDPTINELRPSFAECSLTPPGRIDAVAGSRTAVRGQRSNDPVRASATRMRLPARGACWWMAEDSEGAVSSERFSVTLGNLAPTLTVTNLPFLVLPPAVASTSRGPGCLRERNGQLPRSA